MWRKIIIFFVNTQYLHNELLQWYESHRRDLPWRDTTDPYAIWISEIILQQTRVAQGLDYYLRFMSRFPAIADLAQADEQEVLLFWQGLGYYSRARNLHAAAKQIMQSYNGVFPTEYSQVRSLRGVGDYTSAAICSFAYNAPYAVVDGNVYRVLSRLLDDETPIDTTIGKRRFQQLADRLLDKNEPRLYNQAVMELGALCCIPQTPHCEECPLRQLCMAYAHQTAVLLPVKSKTKTIRERYFTHLIYINSQSQTLLQRREEKDIWHHLYQFPLVESDHLLGTAEVENEYLKENEQLVKEVELTHVLTHQRINARFFVIKSVSLPKWNGSSVVSLSNIHDYPLSRLTLRAMQLLE